MTMLPRTLLVLALALAFSRSADARPTIREVGVASARVYVGDLASGLTREAADVDIGPAPAAGGSRLIDREEIVQALRAKHIVEPAGLPSAVRVVRKMKRLWAADLETIVRDALAEKLTPGVALSAVHPLQFVDVPEGCTRITADLTRPPHRKGPFPSVVRLTFYDAAQALWMLTVPVDLTLSDEALVSDVQRGNRVTLVIRRGLVEVSSAGTAGADADVGNLIPIVLHPSGRIIQARVEDKDHAVAVDTP
jgi:hypothetical protein